MIANITQSTQGWVFAIADHTGGVDVWLDGDLIAENHLGNTYEYRGTSPRPPHLEIVLYGERAVNMWAASYAKLQWYCGDSRYWIVRVMQAGQVIREEAVTVADATALYYTHTLAIDRDSEFAVVPACRADGVIFAAGEPVTYFQSAFFLPRQAPEIDWSYNDATHELTIFEVGR